jgi:DNA-binding transcriptional regulator YiaG
MADDFLDDIIATMRRRTRQQEEIAHEEKLALIRAQSHAVLRTGPAEEPTEPKKETIGEQIKYLRDECRLTIEDLAPKLGIEPRSIQRHEANQSKPHARHLAAYERVFSKLLKRQIVINKMS